MTTLSRKILLLALVNLLSLALLLLGFAFWQLRIGPESLLLGPARDRVLNIANAFSLEFNSSPLESRAALMDAYGKRYAAEFFLVHPRGWIAGAHVKPPFVIDGYAVAIAAGFEFGELVRVGGSAIGLDIEGYENLVIRHV